MYGMPFGAPSHTVPKSGWRFRTPHDAMSVDEFGSTAAPVTTVFHALSAGNGRLPFSDSPPLAGGDCEPPGSVEDVVPAVSDALHATSVRAARRRIVRRRSCIWKSRKERHLAPCAGSPGACQRLRRSPLRIR